MSEAVVEATHELTRPGQRESYVASTLPVTNETGEAMDYSDASYENLRNCASGIASIWDDHTLAIDAVNRDPQFNEFAPPYKQMKMTQARQAVVASTAKSLARLEAIADGAEREANELAAELTAPEKVEPAAAQTIVTSYLELSKESRVEVAHRAAKLLAADSGADAITRRHAREYLAALLQVNPLTNLIDPNTREFISRVMAKSKDPAKWNRIAHLATAAKGIKESAQRVRALISR
jgi:hypothetical protein